MNQFIVIEKTGSYQYYINYTLTNDTPDKKIPEGTFFLYERNSSGVQPQLGFFGELFPGDSWTRTYVFEDLKSVSYEALGYIPEGHDYRTSEPQPNTLLWQVIIIKYV
jgi:hypothetical protein